MQGIIATCTPGLEDVSIEELADFGLKGEKIGRGIISTNAKLSDVFKLNYCSKSLHKIILLLSSGEFSKLSELYRAAYEIDYSEFIRPEQSFAVRVSRAGKHTFTSIDAEREIGQAIIDSYRKENGIRLRVDLEEPDVLVRCYIRENKFWLGIDTTGESLHKRGYRIYEHPAPLRTSIAHCLIRLAEWKGSESLYDPFCGSGTIPIEAGLFACRIPNHWRWKSFRLWKLGFVDTEKFMEEKKRIDAEVKSLELKLYGSDLFRKHIEGAKRNASNAGVSIDFFQRDIKDAIFEHDVIVTNPPYGKRIGHTGKALYANRMFEKKLAEGSWKRAVVITAEKRNLESYSEKRQIMYGDLPTWVFVYKR
ncbi:MAG: class I SAM-dependent RNA methyltransferase [Candidatus Diapherotrites archaeon]|nr:class I SAM-dependent RNA methyltransferase [Candidatus Diapherotrites archaeon]